MSIGKHTSLEEARRKKKLKRFMKEHDSRGDKSKFEKLLNAMSKSKNPLKGSETFRKD